MKRFALGALLISALFVSSNAYASAPTLALSLQSGGAVQARVAGSSNANITLYYTSPSGPRSTPLGTTDSSGSFSSVLSTDNYTVTAGSSAYVVLGDSVAGARSASVLWPSQAQVVSQISLPFTSVTIGSTQSIVVPVYGLGGGSVYIENVSTPSVRANVSGSIVTLQGQSAGLAVVTVCMVGSTSNCQTLTVTVQGTTNGSFGFSSASPVVVAGQSTVVAITGASSGAFYTSTNSNPSVAQAGVSGNAITINGTSVGTSVVSVCVAGGGCAPLTISVLDKNTNISTTGPTLSQGSVGVTVGQSATVLIAGNASYTAESNNTNIATVVLSNGTNLVITGVAPGTATISACDSTDVCGYVSVVVAPAPVSAPVPASTPSAPPVKYIFSTFLTTGSNGTAVTNLQKKLTALGIYTGPITGHYGARTAAAVKKFQAAHAIKQAGYVGPGTRTVLNAN